MKYILLVHISKDSFEAPKDPALAAGQSASPTQSASTVKAELGGTPSERRTE
jgi:hypothetical protein